MAELVKIKPEADIKLEPDDEIDTIEYEQPLNRLDGPFAVKVEKVELGDDHAEEVPVSFDQLGFSNSFNTIANVATKLRNDADPVNNDRYLEERSSLRMKKFPNKRKGATKSRNGKSVVGAKTFTIAKPNGKPKNSIGKTKNKRTALLPLKKRHNCSDCDYYTTIKCNLKRHMLRHAGEKPFPCDSCGKRFVQKSELQKHLKVHVNKDSVHCSGCWQIFTSKEEKLNHESICKQRSYECFLCQSFSTTNIAHLKGHMRLHSGVRPFQCAQCSIEFVQEIHLKKHRKTHSRPQKPRCSVCARNFSKESEKDTHESKCNQRRYDCYLCKSYMSNWKYSLQLHMRKKHTGVRPFKCGSCEKCYAAKERLKNHIKRIHKH